MSADCDLPARHVVYETSEGHRVVGHEHTDSDAVDRNDLRGAFSTAGVALGFAALLRGQRPRVEAELAN